MALSSYIRKKERSQINILSSHFKKLEKLEQIKPKSSWRKEIIKVRKQPNCFNKNRLKTIKRINEIKSLFFEKTNEIDNFLAKLTKKIREKTQISNNRNKNMNICENPPWTISKVNPAQYKKDNISRQFGIYPK